MDLAEMAPVPGSAVPGLAPMPGMHAGALPPGMTHTDLTAEDWMNMAGMVNPPPPPHVDPRYYAHTVSIMTMRAG